MKIGFDKGIWQGRRNMDFNNAKNHLETAIDITERKLSIAKAEFEKENYVESYAAMKEITDYLGGLDGLHNKLTESNKSTVLGTLEDWEKKGSEWKKYRIRRVRFT